MWELKKFMKLKFNTNITYLMKILHLSNIIYIKNTYHRSLSRHNRSTVLDFATIYPSESKIGNLGR